MHIGTYIKLILIKKNMTQQALVDRLNELGLTNNNEIVRKHTISDIVNGKLTISPFMARRLEIALDMPKYSIVNLIGLPKTEIGIKKLEEIEGKIMRIPYKK
nr:MAG TPA: Transcriptional regulator, Transcriptional activator, TPR, HTH [Bacteriophage sp.]